MRVLNRTLLYTVLIIFAFVMIVPFLWMVLTAFKTNTEAMAVDPIVIFPGQWRWDAFQSVLVQFDFIRLYANTIAMIAGRVIMALLTATTAGYAFARLRFPGRNFLFGLVLFQMLVPGQVFIIPQFLMLSAMGQLNTIFALVFPGLVTAFGTFLLRQHFMRMPKELEEAARLDGCNIGQTFLFIMLPLAKSSMAALGIFTAIFAYTDLLWPMVVATRNDTATLAVALARLQGQFTNDFPELMAAAFMASVPMIIIYLIFQKQFVEGVSATGGKL